MIANFQTLSHSGCSTKANSKLEVRNLDCTTEHDDNDDDDDDDNDDYDGVVVLVLAW